jgi:copper(I)-binding protein
MKKKIFVLLTVLGLATACAPTEQLEDHTDHITIENAYVRATDEMSEMMGMLMTGAFMELTNNHEESVTLIGGSCDCAETVEIHEVVGGVMQPKEGGLAIAGGATETLKPGGNHVMLIGLDKDLVAGTEVTFTLEFSDGHTVEVTAPVKVVNLDQEEYEN